MAKTKENMKAKPAKKEVKEVFRVRRVKTDDPDPSNIEVVINENAEEGYRLAFMTATGKPHTLDLTFELAGVFTDPDLDMARMVRDRAEDSED